jgi:hypothetical protein
MLTANDVVRRRRNVSGAPYWNFTGGERNVNLNIVPVGVNVNVGVCG